MRQSWRYMADQSLCGQWTSGITPGLHAAIERHRAHESHRPQGRRGKGGDPSEFAAHQYPPCRILQFVVDPQLELPARQVLGPGYMPRLVRVAFANIQHQDLIGAVLEGCFE